MSTKAPRRRKEIEEEHENTERWLLTYADMITLLMVLFIVMFAISQVDQKQFAALKSGLSAGFGQSTSILDGSSAVLEEQGTTTVPPVAQADFSVELQEIKPEEVDKVVQEAERQRNQRKYAEAAAEVSRLEDVRRRLMAALTKEGLANDVRTKIDGRGLTVSLVSQHVVFAANMPTLTDRGKRVVDVLTPVLRDLPDKLEIDGHTNQVAVQPKYFPTDWELSAARAITVLRRLNEVGGVKNERMTAVAFGHEKPLMDPDEPGSQRLNKRVDIVVLSDLPEETRELLNQAAGDRARATGGS